MLGELLLLSLLASTARSGVDCRSNENYCSIAKASPGFACSENFEKTSKCYNEKNPPAPSILRSLAHPTRDDPTTLPFNAHKNAPAPGKSMALPWNRATNDNRIILSSNERLVPSLWVFRPESLGKDQKIQKKENGAVLDPLSIPIEVSPIHYFNPFDTSLKHPENAQWHEFRSSQFNLCDDSGAAAQAEEKFQISSRRNPIRCEAAYDRKKKPGSSLEGDCYDVTLMFSMEGQNRYARGEKKYDYVQWELRSVDVTLFVGKAKTTEAGPLWIYPRMDSNRPLPDYVDYDLQGKDLSVLSIPECYSDLKNLTRKRTENNLWCEFLDHQSWSKSGFKIGDRHWSGAGCQGPNREKDCGPWALFEPTTTADGKLLFVNSLQGIGYLYNAENSCRAEGFKEIKNLSNIMLDPIVSKKYAIAKNQRRPDGTTKPFRGIDGEEFKPGPLGKKGSTIFGAYLWVDREGKNLFFSHLNGFRDAYRAKHNGVEENPDQEAGKGFSVLGAWTQGKIVHIDSMASYADFGGKQNQEHKPNEKAVRTYTFGPYRDQAPLEVAPDGVFMLQSFENQFNFYDALSPVTPSDVVWKIASRNQRVTEIAFDPYLQNNAFVIAPMNASGESWLATFKDGFSCTRDPKDLRKFHDCTFRESPVLQNAATSDRFFSPKAVTPPRELFLRGGARIEPVALGGVIGKGVYLDGKNDFVEIPYQADQTSHSNWTFSLWIDSRESDFSKTRTVFSYPNGSWIGISGNAITAYSNKKTGEPEVKSLSIRGLVQKGKYFHLALKSEATPTGRDLTFYLNGTLVSNEKETSLHFENPLSFGLMTGSKKANLQIGARAEGETASLHAWIDDLRIFSRERSELHSPMSDELICNEALGSLVDLSARKDEPRGGAVHEQLKRLRNRAALYSVRATPFCEQLNLESFPGYTDFAPPAAFGYLCADKVHANPHSTEGARCLRKKFLSTDALPLVADRPRPDFSKNLFCLSCHHSNATLPSLTLGALVENRSVTRTLDSRRQPTDWPAVLSGTPASFIPEKFHPPYFLDLILRDRKREP